MEDGSFYTAQAKVYPPALNSLLAQGVTEHALAVFQDGASRDFCPDAFDHLRAEHEVCTDIQPDFHKAHNI